MGSWGTVSSPLSGHIKAVSGKSRAAEAALLHHSWAAHSWKPGRDPRERHFFPDTDSQQKPVFKHSPAVFNSEIYCACWNESLLVFVARLTVNACRDGACMPHPYGWTQVMLGWTWGYGPDSTTAWLLAPEDNWNNKNRVKLHFYITQSRAEVY